MSYWTQETAQTILWLYILGHMFKLHTWTTERDAIRFCYRHGIYKEEA